MGKRGPAPKPSALKVLAGNPGGKPLPPAEPQPAKLLAVPKAPSWLDAEGRREWVRMGEKLLALGLLTDLDLAAFLGYCQSYSTWVRAQRELKKGGIIIEVNGVMQRNPWAKVGDEAHTQLQAALKQFGMTPSARVRVNGGGDGGGESDELVNRIAAKMGGPN